MVTRQIALAFPVTAGYDSEVVQGIAQFALEHGSWTFLTAPETSHMSVLSLKGWPGDGVLADIVTREEARAAHKLGIPVVNLASSLADADLPRVRNDQPAIGRLAAEHLLHCELQRFAYYGVKDVWFSRQRGQGFVERLAQAGHTCAVLEGGRAFGKERSWYHWLEELRAWLKTMKPPFGVMACHDNRARMVIDTCRQLGLFVPHDVAVIGADNDWLACEVTPPTLTSVARNGREIGYRAAQLLERLLSGRRPPKNDVIVPLAGVIARESTNMVPVDDPDLGLAVRFIREHVGQPFTLADLLHEVPVSRRWLEYRFRDRFGRSPHQYVCEARIELARRLLLEEEKPSIEQIVKACGFSGARSFRLVFHRLTGMSPSEYRRSHQVSRRTTLRG